ncbi:Rieske 2Fe-2S domain-containing protein [Rhodospirillaceae bacterium KN72]|uniref:Rieske 2Fe-2S domain-containing protein n=1 Tax=Pacificispira spongiicola TaxID=2729598 RepID=A0A7Y0HIG8_9PROT|nr:Rieske 2Fe-2S domain-containing protein [Pacificispira spongiicola]NMM46539.1 Rieske 2Fe-2S domain-containing protein [Pacificispira spongiicola]
MMELDFDTLIHENKVHRSLYTDPAIFDRELTRVFGGTWVYLAHESQVPDRNSFFRTKLGLRPIIVVRDSKGTIRALYNRCTHRGATICRAKQGKARNFSCPYHGWSFNNSGALLGVPWNDGYAHDHKAEDRFNLAQVPRVAVYRGFIFGTLNPDAPSLEEHLGPVRKPIDDWLDRNPGGKVVLCEANRMRFKGNWKLAYDNSADGYHVVFSHRSLLMMENRFGDDDPKGMSFYKQRPDDGPVRVHYFGNGHHFKDKRPALPDRPGAVWEVEGKHPGMEGYEAEIRQRYGDKADGYLDLAAGIPMNINVFPNLLILGNHIQVLEPLSHDETATTWYGTAVVDEDGSLDGADRMINALRMRTQEQFPLFGEVDDLTNFEEIQAGLAAEEDPWVYMDRGLGLPDRFTVEDGVISGPATDEVFMREYMKHYKSLMKADPTLTISRGEA